MQLLKFPSTMLRSLLPCVDVLLADMTVPAGLLCWPNVQKLCSQAVSRAERRLCSLRVVF